MDLHHVDITSIIIGYKESQCHSITIDVCNKVPKEHCGDEHLDICVDMPRESCTDVMSERVE